MSGTKIKTLLKNLKTQNETSLETFQELPLTIQDDSSTAPVNLKLSLTENSVDIRPTGSTTGIGISGSTISLGSFTSIAGSTLSATNFTMSGDLILDNFTVGTLSVGTITPNEGSTVKVGVDAASTAPAGLLISKPGAGSGGSAFVSAGETYYSGENSYTEGCRLAWQGAGSGTQSLSPSSYNLGTKFGLLQALNVESSGSGGYIETVYNIMSWLNNGTDVKIYSEDDLLLFAKEKLEMDLENPTGAQGDTKDRIFESEIRGNSTTRFHDSYTAIRSYRDVELMLGMGCESESVLQAYGSKISFRKPTWSGGDMSGNGEEIASIDQTGKMSVSSAVETIAGGFSLAADDSAADWGLYSKDGSGNLYPVLKNGQDGDNTTLYSKHRFRVIIDEDESLASNSLQHVDYGVYLGGTVEPGQAIPTNSGATELFRVDGLARVFVTRLLQKTTETTLYLGSNTDTANVEIGASSDIDIGTSNTNNVNLYATDKISIEAPLVPPVSTNVLEVKAENATGSAVGIAISKPTHGSSFISLTEGNSSGVGCRLVHEGDSTEEDMGTTSDGQSALQGIWTVNGANTYNTVFRFNRSGNDVHVESAANITIDAPTKIEIDGPTDFTGGAVNFGSTVDFDGVTRINHNLEIGGDIDGGISFTYKRVPYDTSTTADQYDVLGMLDYTVPGQPSVTDSTNSTATTAGHVRRIRSSDVVSKFFSASHIYATDSLIPSGSSVILQGGVASVSSAANSKVCAGIACFSKEYTARDVMTSLASIDADNPPQYLVWVVAVGDSRHKECQGFNVCNENGDIQPGDLLVTSNTPGYLMKQDDDIIRSCTVGKAMETVTFDDNGQATGVYGYLYCG